MGYPRRRFALAGQCEMDIQSETKWDAAETGTENDSDRNSWLRHAQTI